MTRRTKGKGLGAALVALGLLGAVACGGPDAGSAAGSAPEPVPATESATAAPTESATSTETETASPPGTQTVTESAPAPDATATLAFAGDVHFEGSSARALDEGLGGVAELFRSADLAVVNLETAITERGDPAPKEYTFRAPARAFDVLLEAGVSAVSLANNHGMDYGQQGLADTLDAAQAAGMPLLGAGRNEAEAHAPLHVTLDGIEISVLAATDVLDSFAQDAWVAGPTQPGLAQSKDPRMLLEAVRAEAARADVVAVYLHWGREREACPTPRQQELAAQLAEAGADIIVGTHAHVLLPAAQVGDAYVHYGLGNFVLYARDGAASESGVLLVQIGPDGVREAQWHPATISGGVPVLAVGEEAVTARQRWESSACG